MGVGVGMMATRVGVMHNSAGALFLPSHDPSPHLHQHLDKHALEQVRKVMALVTLLMMSLALLPY